MSGERKSRGEAIRRFILEQAEKQGKDIVRATAERFGITRQAVNRHIKPLVDQDLLVPAGATRNRHYELGVLAQETFTLNLSGLEEHVVWLVSRSQAKRLLARVDRFKTVLLDFSGIESVGQAFADEIFRVFRKQHPEVAILPCNANEAVERMINRALGANGNGGVL